MIFVEQPLLRRKSKRVRLPKSFTHVEIPGGWKARVPEIQLDDDSLRHWMETVSRTGLGLRSSEDTVLNQMQALFQNGFLGSLRDSVFHHAEHYIETYPGLVLRGRVPYSCEPGGFDPERVQVLHTLACGRVTGRAGLGPVVEKLYNEFSDEAIR